MYGKDKLMVGQRVLLNGEEIGTITTGPKTENGLYNNNNHTYIWVLSPTKGYESQYAIHNVKPLPNGQL